MKSLILQVLLFCWLLPCKAGTEKLCSGQICDTEGFLKKNDVLRLSSEICTWEAVSSSLPSSCWTTEKSQECRNWTSLVVGPNKDVQVDDSWKSWLMGSCEDVVVIVYSFNDSNCDGVFSFEDSENNTVATATVPQYRHLTRLASHILQLYFTAKSVGLVPIMTALNESIATNCKIKAGKLTYTAATPSIPITTPPHLNASAEQNGSTTDGHQLTRHSHHGNVLDAILTILCAFCGSSGLIAFVLYFRRLRHCLCSLCGICRDTERLLDDY